MAGLRTVKRKMGAEPTVMSVQLPRYQDMVRVPSLSMNSLSCEAGGQAREGWFSEKVV
jgi:hypothetical protein